MWGKVVFWGRAGTVVYQLFVGSEWLKFQLYGELGVLGVLNIPVSTPQSLYIALFGGGIFVLAGLCWPLVIRWNNRRWANRPEIRFGQMHRALLVESHEIERELNYGQDSRSNWNRQQSRRSLSVKLNELGIKCPAEHSDREWVTFIYYIVTLSETRDLNAAKNLMSLIRQQKEDRK